MKSVAVQSVSVKGLQRPAVINRPFCRRQNLVVRGVAEADRDTVSARPTVCVFCNVLVSYQGAFNARLFTRCSQMYQREPQL
jgi:hypothetical protein